MGMLLQPGNVLLCPFWTCPYHQFVRSPEGWWELLCSEATTVEPEKRTGLAQDIFDLPQDQTLLINPTLCAPKERQEAPVDRGEADFQCCWFGHWATPA